ncbi:MAG: hypothetical protein AAFN70_06330, partial [Planctomycetota bacterium]
MNENERMQQIDAILTRLDALGFLPAIVIRSVERKLRELNLQELQFYVDHRLTWLENHRASSAHPAFIQVSQQFQALESESQVRQLLGIPENVAWDAWLQHAYGHQINPPVSLACCTAAIALQTQGCTADQWVPLLTLSASAMSRLGDHIQATVVCESYLKITPDDYQNPEALRERIDQSLRKTLEANNAATFVKTLADTLRFVSRPADAAAVMDCYSDGFEFLNQEESPLTINNVASLVLTRLRLENDDASRRRELIIRYTQWMTRQLAHQSVGSVNRGYLMRSIRALRHHAIDFADRQAITADRSGDSAEAELWRRQGLVWDTDLAQRILLESILEPKWVPKAGDGEALLEGSLWPMETPDSPPEWKGWRPEHPRFEASTNVALDSLTTSPVTAHHHAAASDPKGEMGSLVQMSEQRRATFREALDTPMSEDAIAEYLGKNTLLVRCRLEEVTGLSCSAWKSNGRQLSLVAANDRSDGSPDDRRRIQNALDRHAWAIAVAYAPDGATDALCAAIASESMDFFAESREQEVAEIAERLERLLLLSPTVSVTSTFFQITSVWFKEWIRRSSGTHRAALS